MEITSGTGLTEDVYKRQGVVGLTKTVARELASRHINCNAIAPGAIRTPMTDAMDPKDLQAILEMCIRDSPSIVTKVSPFQSPAGLFNRKPVLTPQDTHTILCQLLPFGTRAIYDILAEKSRLILSKQAQSSKLFFLLFRLVLLV